MPMILSSRKTRAAKRPRGRGKGKVSIRSLHGQGVQVSVDERVADLARRFPALRTMLGTLLSESKKRIRDLPDPERAKLLRIVFALKKASGG